MVLLVILSMFMTHMLRHKLELMSTFTINWRELNIKFCQNLPSLQHSGVSKHVWPGKHSNGSDIVEKSKIILHRIISVVWLTNFLSEIRNLTNSRWWGEQLFLSVKRCQNSLLEGLEHWWSLIAHTWVVKGQVAVWVIWLVSPLGFEILFIIVYFLRCARKLP